MSFQATLTKEPIYIHADENEPKEVLNVGGEVAFHKTTADVDHEDTALETGERVVLTEGRYFVSKNRSEINVRTSTPEEVEQTDAAPPAEPKPKPKPAKSQAKAKAKSKSSGSPRGKSRKS